MKRLLIILLLLLPLPVHAAITIDAISTDDGMNGGNIIISHTAAADATLALVCASDRDTTENTLGANPTATYAGNAMTAVPGAIGTYSDTMRSSMFYYVSPPSGASNIELNESASSDRYVMSVITLKGTATTDIFNTASATGASSASADIDGLASAVGEFAVMCGAIRTNTPTVSPDATSPVSTEQVEYDHPDAIGITHFVYTEDGAATSINMRVDISASQWWAAAAVSIRPAVSASVRRQAPVFYP